MSAVSKWLMTASLLLALGVILGAFGAHGLKNRLDEYSMGVYEKAVFYHMIHALGLLFVAILPQLTLVAEHSAWRVNAMLALGIVFFSGSLYVLAISGIKWLGAITPIGGSLFIAAWLYLAYSIWAHSSSVAQVN